MESNAMQKMAYIMKFIRGGVWSLLLVLLMITNLAYMHYEVYFTRNNVPGLKPYYTPFVFICFDVLVTLIVCSALSLRKRSLSYALAYLLIFVIAIFNIGYSRFFYQYVSLEVFQEFGNLTGTWWLQYVPDGFRGSDLILLFSAVIATYGVWKIKNNKEKVSIINLCMALLLILSFHAIIGRKYLSNVKASTYSSFYAWYDKNFGPDFQGTFLCNPDVSIVQNGIIRTQVLCNILSNSTRDGRLRLSQGEIGEIDKYIESKNKNEGELIDYNIIEEGKPDIIFILVESLMSFAIQENANGREVMPNLNKILRSKHCYSNLSMISDKGCGESSDAQISYLTGIKPLKQAISVSYIIYNTVISLPQLLKNKGYNTYITIPTDPGFWHQETVNKKYGLTNMTALGTWTNDSLVFDSVIANTHKLKSPYFSLILTLSMHGPYEGDNLPQIDFPCDFPCSYSKEYKNYLKRCYYTDLQIGRYITYLKKTHKYDNSIIIIVSDHEVKENSLAMESLKDRKELPFILVNTKADSTNAINREMHQVDVYSTLLDLFGLETKWRGTGYSIFRKRQKSPKDSSSEQISKKIILGDYFKYTKIME